MEEGKEVELLGEPWVQLPDRRVPARREDLVAWMARRMGLATLLIIPLEVGLDDELA
jgi:hypothetical protein